MIHTKMIAVAAGTLLLLVQTASAQKLTYQQAFAKCKQEIGASVPGENAQSSGRYAAGGACMNKYGFRLKKKAKF